MTTRRYKTIAHNEMIVLSGFFLALLLVLAPSSAPAWKIEKDKIIIEEGDDLWSISYCLFGKGWWYDRLWDARLDTNLTRDPNLVYAGMKFSWQDHIFGFAERPRLLTEIRQDLAKSVSITDSICKAVYKMIPQEPQSKLKENIRIITTLIVSLIQGIFIGVAADVISKKLGF